MAIKALGLESKSAGERIQALITIDAEELRTKPMAVPVLPIVDRDLPLAPQTFSDFSSGEVDLPGVKWCGSIMTGDCQFDGNVQSLRIAHRKEGIAKAFCDAMRDSFSTAELTDKLLQGYEIDSGLDDDAAFIKVLEVLNDIGFYAPTIAYAEALSKKGTKTYMYRFNEANPWEGLWKGASNHILDIAFLFQNFNDYLDEAQRESAVCFAKDVTGFVNGKQPWEEWTKAAPKAKVRGPHGGEWVVSDRPDQVERRNVLFELAEQDAGSMDHLSEVLNAFLRGPAT